MNIDPYWQQQPAVGLSLHVTALFFYVFFCITGMIANLTVILHYARFQKVIKPHDYLLINLMVADLLIICVNLPMATINCLNGGWSFGQIGCNIYGFTGALSGFVSISTMVLISIERVLAIRKPFKVLSSNKSSSICMYTPLCFLRISKLVFYLQVVLSPLGHTD
jgi:7 transmembrane receptor (rhodopsin family)